MKDLSDRQLSELAREIRREIIETVARNGGHLASNLGVVELAIALHRAFDVPRDAIVWDVGHQCYAHKLLTGRFSRFASLREKGGLSGFTRKDESPCDFFDSGHASNSISQALGLLVAKDLRKTGGSVVAVIGDGALTGGMALEALSHAGQLSKNLIVVLNDNQMSIALNTGSISRYLSRMTMSAGYQTLRRKIDRLIDKVPYFNRHLEKFIFRFKRALKGLFLTNNLFVDLGFEYVGPLNGHDEKALEEVLRRVKKLSRPVVVHVVTKKGKGYSPAEDRPEDFHGVGPFCISDGTVEKFDKMSFTEAFSDSICALARRRDGVVAVTAAMAKGTGLDSFARHFPNRFFDVGIAEEHAVAFGGALAEGGLEPFVCVYSTFIQRSVDQVIHDVALQKSRVVIVLGRAGPVPGDGETHQGLFDIALFRPVPGVKILCPASAADLRLCMDYALGCGGPVILRFPKNACPTERDAFALPVEEGRGTLVDCGSFAPSLELQLPRGCPRVLLACSGGMYPETLEAARALLMKGIRADVYALRFIKPIDEKFFVSIARGFDGVLLAEDGIVTGGVSEHLRGVLAESGISNVAVKAFPEKFFAQGTRAEILEDALMSPRFLEAEAAALALKARGGEL